MKSRPTGGMLGKVTEVGEQFLSVEIAAGRERQAAEIPGRARCCQRARSRAHDRLSALEDRVGRDRDCCLGSSWRCPICSASESALQLAADRAAVTDGDRSAVEQILKDKGVTPSGVFLEQGRLTLRFAQQDGSVEGARHDFRGAPRSVHDCAVAGLARARLDASARTAARETRPGSSRRRLPRLPGGRAGRGKAAARSARTGFSRFTAQRPRRVSGRGGGLPGESDSRAVSRRRQFCQGQSGHPRRQPQPEADRHHGRGGAGPGIAADAAGDQGAADLRDPTKHRHSAQSSQQSGTCGIRTASGQ